MVYYITAEGSHICLPWVFAEETHAGKGKNCERRHAARVGTPHAVRQSSYRQLLLNEFELECAISWSIRVRVPESPQHSRRQVQQLLDTKVIYRRYASLFFVCGIGAEDNELVTLEIIHRYVEVLDRYFGNVRDAVVHGASI